MENIKAVLFGVGAVGSLIGKQLLCKEGIEVVGAIDSAKEKIGKDLGTVLNLPESLGVTVSNDAATVIKETGANIVIHATSSYLKDVFPQIAPVVQAGVNVISTCEELSYPYFSDPQCASDLDALAKKGSATVLGTGINPGFLMDTLVTTLTVVCQRIDAIQVVRIMNAANRRVPFQKKIGSGLTEKRFFETLKNGLITGHVGLEESVSMIAAAIGWKMEKITSDLEPVIAKKYVTSSAFKIDPGSVAGLKQIVHGYRRGKAAIILEFQAYIGAEDEYDSISIKGVPDVNQKITPCVHGDISTVAVIVNTIPKVINASPGLVTMKDLPIPTATLGNMVEFIRK